MAAYHASELATLVKHVGEAIDQFQAGEIDAFGVDAVIFHYGRAAKELWKFCNLADVEFTAQTLADRPSIDWWKLGEPHRRR